MHDTSKETFLGGFVSVKLPCAEFSKELGVFLVGEAVSGYVVGGFSDGFLEIGFPFLGCLMGNSEHEVDVD